MASPREIKKRINSVKNTKKITRTMEMVATAKSKKMSDKVNASKPFSDKVKEMVGSLSSLSSQVQSPLLRKPEKIQKVALLVITANRGLCGGYNSNTIRIARNRLKEFTEKGITCDLYVIGKKGISFFKYIKQNVVESYTNIDDNSGYKEAEFFAKKFMKLFADESIDAVEIVSTVYHSSSSQTPELTKILPLESSEGSSASVQDSIIYEPDPQKILESLLPLVIKTGFYKAIMEAVCSEQIARRIAMKSATDAASEMIKLLTRGYNRVRQAKITQEISEIVGGADSLQ
ncbi:MAG: ATP synthase F1 subunit gamma [Leptospiraceae bacterium]|nr:ATP synthase F1 subunit gamma [Leptospiraceae bacterium]